ncbi:MAG TPA: hypothetical protein VGI10_20120 [Polyangiaceae bacterium]
MPSLYGSDERALLPPALFVNWQDESSRRIFPVGRLVTLTPEGYEFAYIGAAREAQ